MLHRPTVVRTLVLSAGLTVLLYVVVRVLAPSLVELGSDGTARGIVFVVGIMVRVLAGRRAARPAWEAGADLPFMLVSVVVGGALGWLVFPGLLSLIGVMADGTLGTLVSLLADLALWLVCLAVGVLLLRLRPLADARA